MKKLKRWWAKRPMIDKIFLIGVPSVILIAVLLIRMVFISFVNNGKEIPLPVAVQDTGKVNLDTLANKQYKLDAMRSGEEKKDTTQIVLKSNLVPSSYISKPSEGRLVDDVQREEVTSPNTIANQPIAPTSTPLPQNQYAQRVRPTRNDLYVPQVNTPTPIKNTVQKQAEDNNSDDFGIIRGSGQKNASKQPQAETQDDQGGGEKPLGAVINGNQVVTNGSRLSIKITQTGMLKDLKVTAGTILYGKVVIYDNRVTCNIDRIPMNGKVYSTALTALDIDYNEGLAFDLGKAGKNNTLKEKGGNVLDQALTRVTGGLVNGGSDAIRRSGGLKENTVPLSNGRKLFLVSL